MSKDKYYLIKTYGCQMNVHESEKLAGVFASLGYKETDNQDKADVILFNTCCIRDSAEQKLYGHIGALKKLKQNKRDLIICVCGCAPQADGRAKLIKSKFPFVDIIFGTHNTYLFKEYLESFLENNKYICDVWEEEQGIDETSTPYRTSGLNAWVNISYGCNNFCSYCIVPFVRGRERSRSMTDITNEVKELVSSGYKYITLLGQNVNSYGNDIEDKQITFANLLKACAEIEGDFRLKFMTSHPKDLNEEVIKTIASNDKISKVIHLPIQSGSNNVLKAMNRKYTKEHYLSLIKTTRKYIPDAIISTDIIVGFPGETEEDFNETYQLIKDVRYDGVFAYMYSKRTGTVAEKMHNQVPATIKRERVNKLLELSKSIIKEKNIEQIGRSFNVLLNTYDVNKKSYTAITDSGKHIQLPSNFALDTNKFYRVKVTEIIKNKLVGKIVDF